jgi:hypothetical protein
MGRVEEEQKNMEVHKLKHVRPARIADRNEKKLIVSRSQTNDFSSKRKEQTQLTGAMKNHHEQMKPTFQIARRQRKLCDKEKTPRPESGYKDGAQRESEVPSHIQDHACHQG